MQPRTAVLQHVGRPPALWFCYSALLRHCKGKGQRVGELEMVLKDESDGPKEMTPLNGGRLFVVAVSQKVSSERFAFAWRPPRMKCAAMS